jgi:hypothetical protein
MKKALLATAITASLVGALVIAPASASANYSVLCSVTTNPTCPIASTYPVGTEVKSELAPGSVAKVTDAFGIVQASCSKSQIDVTLKQKIEAREDQRVDPKTFTYSECANPIKVVSNGGGILNWTEGFNGKLSYWNQIELYVPAFARNCRFELWGPPTLTGGTSPVLTYTKASLLAVGSPESTFCDPNMYGKLYFYGTYNVTTPKPIYVRTW